MSRHWAAAGRRGQWPEQVTKSPSQQPIGPIPVARPCEVTGLDESGPLPQSPASRLPGVWDPLAPHLCAPEPESCPNARTGLGPGCTEWGPHRLWLMPLTPVAAELLGFCEHVHPGACTYVTDV